MSARNSLWLIAAAKPADNSIWRTLIPVVVGAVLGYGLAELGRRGERRHQLARDDFARQSVIAMSLDEALVETQRKAQGHDVPEDMTRWSAALGAWQEGWIRLTPQLRDSELEERYGAVGTILMELDLNGEPDGGHGAALQVVMRAIGNARVALAYWLRREELPTASFPSREQVVKLLGQGDPTPLAADAPLRTWLTDHPQPPWR